MSIFYPPFIIASFFGLMTLSSPMWALDPSTVAGKRDLAHTLAGPLPAALNRDGAVMAQVPASEVAASWVRMAGRTPLVWGRYLPSDGRGSIEVIRALPRPDGEVSISRRAFAPADGDNIARGGLGRSHTYFAGVNPFAQFAQGANTEFRNLNLTGFLAAVGLAMRVHGATTAIVNYPAITASEAHQYAGDIRSGETRTVALQTHARWLVGVPADAATQRRFVPSYRVAACDPALDTRHRCIVPGYASFTPFDHGSLPTDGVLGSTTTRTDGRALDTATLITAFDATAALSRDRVQVGRVWREVAEQTAVVLNGHVLAAHGNRVALAAGTAGALARQPFSIGTGQGTVHESKQAVGQDEYGLFTPGVSGLHDAAWHALLSAPLEQAGGGTGRVAAVLNWQAQRDRAHSSDAASQRDLAPPQSHAIHGIAQTPRSP
jgi:hypothetical protein